MKERASNDKEAFNNKIASEAEAAAYRNDLRSIYVNQQTNECRTAHFALEGPTWQYSPYSGCSLLWCKR